MGLVGRLKKAGCMAMAAASFYSTSPNQASAQETRNERTHYSFVEQASVVGYNILLNGFISGIGATINDRSFFEGFLKGSFGGSLITLGNFMVGREEDLAWPSRIISSVGASVTENTIRGRPMFSRLGMELGPVYLVLEREEEGYNPRVFFMPSSWGSMMFAASEGNFSLKESLRFGTPIFHAPYNQDSLRAARYGILGSNVIMLYGTPSDRTLSHDLVHVNQLTANRNFSFLPFSALNLIKDWGSDLENFLRNTLHVDVNAVTGDGLHYLLNSRLPYNNRPTEWEARIFSGTPPVPER